MYTLAINLNLTEIVILQVGAIILGVAVHFFIVSRKQLKKTIEEAKTSDTITFFAIQKPDVQDNELKELQGKNVSFLKTRKKAVAEEEDYETPVEKTKPFTNFKQEVLDVASVKETIESQQHALDKLLDRIEELQNKAGNQELEEKNKELIEDIEQLEIALEEKESEIKRLKQQEEISKKMAARIDEVYIEFEQLQQKIASMEKQALNASTLELELEEARQSYELAKKELARKGVKLEETIAENQRLHQLLSETEDKLNEANLQRQQLFKKVAYLEDITNEFQDINESNKKLQNEMRRIGELESMLNIIVEERDQLLKKRSL